MAEAGQTKSDNPFSFKKFVNKKDTQPGECSEASADDDKDIFDLPDTGGKQRKREKQKQIIVVEEELPKVKQKKKGKSENPFSFKKFLSGPGSETKTPVNSAVNNFDNRETKPRTEGISLVNPGDLPDFVQDHYSEVPGGKGSLGYPQDKTRHSISPDIGDKNLVTHPEDGAESRLRIPSGSDNDFSDEEQRTPEQKSSLNILPDFLSDTAIGSSSHTVDSGRNAFDSGGDDFGDADAGCNEQLRKLEEENSRLRQQVESLQIKRDQDAQSVSALQHQLVLQKKKEEEETSVMERAMEQVEKNLSDTTQRAVLAETVVTKLKQEVKVLQADVKSLCAENQMLSSGDQYVLDIKERTAYVSEQLSTATKSAETSLRQMLSGVDNLKLLSQVLKSIDKITEEKTSPDGRPDPPGETT